jgi:uncharacterized protein (TIGR03086 family)
MDQIEILILATDEFARILAAVPGDTMADPSTCDEWNVGGLIGHVVGGSRMAVALIGGASAAEALELVLSAGGDADPQAAFTAAGAEQVAAFASADMAAIVHHPAMDMPVAQLLGFRITDLVVHGWDLARSTGLRETIDPRLVEAVWTAIEPMVPMMGSVGVFGEGQSGALDASATLQARMLDACGRRP